MGLEVGEGKRSLVRVKENGVIRLGGESGVGGGRGVQMEMKVDGVLR